MEVYVLKTVKTDAFTNKHKEFFFNSKKDADIFLHVFEDHWCHVDFEGEYREITYIEAVKFPCVDIKQMAERYLGWGFNFAKWNGDDGIREDEKHFIELLTREMDK